MTGEDGVSGSVNRRGKLRYPTAQVVRKFEIASERVGECDIEPQHFEQRFTFNDVQITVRQRAHVRCRLAHCRLLPEQVAEHITTTCLTQIPLSYRLPLSYDDDSDTLIDACMKLLRRLQLLTIHYLQIIYTVS